MEGKSPAEVLETEHHVIQEYVLFPMSNKVLGAADQQQLLEKFEGVEVAMGRDVHQRLERIAEEIAQRTGVMIGRASVDAS